jgi:hypothetical protein
MIVIWIFLPIVIETNQVFLSFLVYFDLEL